MGLGNFGSALAEKLTQTGNEVIGVDSKMTKVEALKERITHTICLDCTDPQAVTHLPVRDADIVIVCIGEDEGANLMATALMKRMNAKRLISRAVSPLHEMILQAMGLDEIVHPEEETAERWMKKLNLAGVVDSLELSDDYSIVEVTVPEQYIGKTLQEADFRNHYNLIALTTIQVTQEKNVLGSLHKVTKVHGVASPTTVLNAGDIIVFYGHIKDIERLLKET